MKIFTCNDFKGYWPVGTSAVIVAKDLKKAKKILLADLKERGLEQTESDFTLRELNIEIESVNILNDGDY